MSTQPFKLYLSLALALISSTIKAEYISTERAETALDNNGNFYAGINLGQNLANGSYQETINLQKYDNPNTGGNTSLSGFSVGYKSSLPYNLVIMTDANLILSNHDKTLQSTTNITTGQEISAVKSNNNIKYGLSVRLGKQFENYSPYILGGVQAGKWQIKTLKNDAAIKIDEEMDSQKLLPLIGLGSEFTITDSINMRFEYSYVFGPKMSKTTEDISTQSNFNQQNINVGLFYSF